MADDFSLNGIITADNSGFIKSIIQCINSLNGFSKSLSTLQTVIRGAFAVKTLQVFVKELNECSRLYIEQAKAEKNLEVAAKNNPYLKPESVRQLKSYASQLQSISEVGDEKLLPLMGQLASAGRTQEEIQAIMSAALDASASGAMSLEQAVKSLNQTYSGTAGRLTMVLPNIKNLTEEELKQGKAVEMVANAYKGIAKETASSSKQLANSIGDLKEELGYGWETALSPMRKGLKEIIDKWSEALRIAREAKAEMTNLENVKAGRGGDIGQASTTQTALLIQQKIELDEYVRLAQLSAKKKKELTKAEQKELYDLRIKYLDNIRALYQGEGETDLQAIQKAVNEKTAAYQKSFEEEKQLVAQHQQELAEQENARTESEKQALQNRLNNLRSAFDGEIAAYKQEIELRRQTGEEITEEQEKLGLLNVARSAYVRMIQASNGEMTEDASRLRVIIRLMEELSVTTEETSEVLEEFGEAQEENLDIDILRDFEKAWEETKNDIEKMATDWTSFFKDVFKQFGEIGKQAFESIGEALAGNGEAWDNFGVKVLEIIAQILEALAAQLSALAVTKAMWWSYGEAAAAAGGAAAALIAAGTLKGVAKTMHATSKAVKDCNNNLETFKKLMDEIIKGGVSSGASAINATFAQISKTVSDAEKNLSDLWEEYNNVLKRFNGHLSMGEFVDLTGKVTTLADKITEATKILEDAKTRLNKYLYGENGLVPTSTNAVNDLKMQIESITDLLKMNFKVQGTSSALKTYLNNIIKKDIIGVFENAYEDLLTIGSNLAQNLISGFTKGLSKKEFMAGLKDYIKQMVVSTALYTEEFAQKIQNVTLSLSQAIVAGNKKEITSAVNSIETLYTTAEGVISNLTSAMDSLFAKYEETADEITDTSSAITDVFKLNLDSIEELIKSFKENLKTLGSDLTSEFVNGLAEGLNEADFMSKMKDYLRKMVIQTVVYTDTLKNEIAAIGKAISEGIANGFTETGLHEIRRDLSYVFNQANSAINKVDSMFNTVFSGYASGTQNATAGLHLVGEAGPEIVRFRGGEQVLNAQATNRVLEGVGKSNNFNVTFNNLQDTSAFAMMSQLKDYQRKMAIDGVF